MQSVKAERAEAALDRRFDAVVFDWDGTAVPDRAADATRLRRAVEALSARAVHVAVVTGTGVENIDRQLRARTRGPGRVYLLVNRGSEVYRLDEGGVALVHRRIASREEDAALTAAAERTKERLAERGVEAAIVSARLNRRKIDLIPVPAWRDPPKAKIDALLRAVESRLARAGMREGLAEVVAIATAAAKEAGLEAPRVTSDAKHVEIGLTDKSDSARWILRELWGLGIGPELVLVGGDEMGPLGNVPGSDSLLLVPEAERATAVTVGVEPGGVPARVVALGGGPETFVHLLEDQVTRRDRGEVPRIDRSPAWVLEVEGLDEELERTHEVALTIADGRIGTSGSPLFDHPAARPRVLALGLYDGEGARSELARCPRWNRLFLRGFELRRTLDLHTGVLRQAQGGRAEAILFSSLARPGVTALWWAGESDASTAADPPLDAPAAPTSIEQGVHEGAHWIREITTTGELVAAAANDDHRRLAAYVVRPSTEPPQREAIERLRAARKAGAETLLCEHRQAWAARWENADVAIGGDLAMQRAVRFALFHLMASVPSEGEAAVGARGLSGPAYLGHVFWDSEVFVLPFLAATHPPSARAILEYRLRRLDAARASANALGRRGARFPWESAARGADVTPGIAPDRTGALVQVRTGESEEHIVADVAWAASCYLDWTGDRAFAEGPGRVLLVETARYWASRIRMDSAGRGHIDGVIGPDEYHEGVDDNAFTNVMARWNLRRAASLAAGAPDVSERERMEWLDAASALVDGFDPKTMLYEQFAGYWKLEPLVIAELAPSRPIAAEILLGRERVQRAQVSKQADVLMLHHMLPDEVARGSLLPNLAYYERRTAHGSSLSPGIHASLFARCGQLDAALSALHVASRIDLDDLTGTTAGGLHLAAMGSVWQALAFGFLGLRPRDDALEIDPHLPERWTAFDLRAMFRGSRVRIHVAGDVARVEADHPMSLRVVGDDAPIDVTARGRTLARRGASWEVVK